LVAHENEIIYVQDSILKASFQETLNILGYAGKDALLEELSDFGVIPDTLSENSDMQHRYSLEDIESALSKVVGAESSSLIMIKLKRIPRDKGWSLAERQEPDFSYSDILRNISTTISKVMGPVFSEQLIHELISQVICISGTEIIDHEYFVIENPEIFEQALAEFMGAGSFALLRTLSASLISEFCPKDVETYSYTKSGDYSALINHGKNNI